MYSRPAPLKKIGELDGCTQANNEILSALVSFLQICRPCSKNLYRDEYKTGNKEKVRKKGNHCLYFRVLFV